MTIKFASDGTSVLFILAEIVESKIVATLTNFQVKLTANFKMTDYHLNKYFYT